MKISIIGAMEEEVSLLREQMTNIKTEMIANSEFTSGSLGGKEVILLKSGIGKVNAAMATTILLEKFRPDVVINTGSAGGYHPDLQIGDLVISTEVRHHDVDATIFGYEYGQVPQMPPAFKADPFLVEKTEEAAKTLEGVRAVKGLIATGDSFMNDPTRAEFVRQQFKELYAVEMEGAAIAQVAWQFDVPFVIIRALSDIAGKESHISFDQFLETAAVHSTNLVLEMIKSL
ncbi:5'-methylthioadenosine/S-adenosylhomocysteine nucleosidase [Lederbergia sp. NSJ-179]|uniref:5'-methylthioadenosine/S-adenosylhomocysteine nucleosidase n=1 Tax=Lederbergia sp. NSJ-179 TaxID=2931402 RepID=UPI001FD1E9D8|nr:5'-methylthioadenosine/S-adenosylhomocysteine nucleosidase [Lederbergia sp. NSJ-179]MCJ7841797.1 5'-methylthioadenosine/S-adenosylhomocysteine nucleosidase [Lederbergia sp. NSJ-179]